LAISVYFCRFSKISRVNGEYPESGMMQTIVKQHWKLQRVSYILKISCTLVHKRLKLPSFCPHSVNFVFW